MTRYDEFPFPGLPSLHELTDASNECRHGRLPFDRGPRCSCWNIAWTPGKVPVVTVPDGCLCGCGEATSMGRRWVQGHNLRAHVREAA